MISWSRLHLHSAFVSKHPFFIPFEVKHAQIVPLVALRFQVAFPGMACHIPKFGAGALPKKAASESVIIKSRFELKNGFRQQAASSEYRYF